MKRLYYIVALISALSLPDVCAQDDADSPQPQERRSPRARTGERETEKKENGLPVLTIRAQDMNERMTQEIGSARWMRVIYRELDMTKEQNTPLYYPVRPVNGAMNFFSTVFQLLSEDKIKAYEYIDGYEVFDDEHIIDFKKDVLDRAYIYYEEVPGAGGKNVPVINESDIPSGDVKAYYIKEAWYFDQNNSVFDVKTLAICPILTIGGDLGEQRLPLFWLPYENIRPYIANSVIMTSNVNNTKTFTMEDFFRRRMFDGEIVKTENLMNKTLREVYPGTDSLELAQQEIEKQLNAFQESLYWKADSSQTVNTKEAKKAARAKAKTERQNAKASPDKTGESEAKAPASPSSERSAPVRSVRKK
ncbi:MAG: gliding motility protein GldN [Bacteroidales bacterium]